MCGGNDKVGADVILNMGSRRLDSVDNAGSAVVVISKRDGRYMGWKVLCGIFCDM
jgi:hypothetical protein